jgi:anti-sigma factor ChrR (cupin superfamily)
MNPLMFDHPSAAELAAFALGRLVERSAMELEAHLAACETCRSAIDAAPTDSNAQCSLLSCKVGA